MNSKIFVDEYQLSSIKLMCRKNPKEMVQQLMRLMLGVEVLRVSSPTGKNGWTPIPDNIFAGVERKYLNVSE